MGDDNCADMSDSEQFVTKIIKRPFIPFWEPLRSGVDIGSCVIVKGRVPRFARQFTFDFIVGQEISLTARTAADVVLRFNVRFEDEGVVANNSRIGTHWGLEERVRKEFPFDRNKWFEVKFLIKESYIKIFIDGSDFCIFLHRIPYHYIGIFSIEGDVEIESVIFASDVINRINENRIQSRMITDGRQREEKSLKTMSEPQIKQQIDHNFNIYTSRHSIVDNMVLTQKTIHNPPLPFCQPIFNSLKDGMTITISGLTKESIKKLEISLKCPQENDCETPDVAISLIVDFEAQEIRSKCRVNGQWVKEEKGRDFFPLKKNKQNQYFELKISVNENRFAISFNGQHYAEYVSRIPDFTKAYVLDIEGHINLVYVKFDASQVN